MEYTKEDIERLQQNRYIIDCDENKVKQKIKSLLLENKDLIHVLNNEELERADAEPSDYFGINILDFYMIEPTQFKVSNFCCYTVDTVEINRYNEVVKLLNITFYLICEQKNIRDRDTGLARHDLLSAIILNQFNWTNYFGAKIHCVSNKESVVDQDYAARVVVFQQETDANVVKTKNGIPKIINKEVHQ